MHEMPRCFLVAKCNNTRACVTWSKCLLYCLQYCLLYCIQYRSELRIVYGFAYSCGSFLGYRRGWRRGWGDGMWGGDKGPVPTVALLVHPGLGGYFYSTVGISMHF